MFNIPIKMNEDSHTNTSLLINYFGNQLIVPDRLYISDGYIAIDDDGTFGFYTTKPTFNESRGMWICKDTNNKYTHIGYLDLSSFNIFNLKPHEFRKASKAIFLESLVPIKELYVGQVSTATISSQVKLTRI